ncbi:MAG: restriction endonuclease subunit S [Nitrosospira sp.]
MELLEQHFDAAFAAPDGIKKLRELILTLAMHGKLVPQDPDDPPASQLLQEIDVEKKRLVKEGKIKAPKPLPEITTEEIPYELREGWQWVRLNEVLDVRDGTHDTPKYVDIGYPLITSKNLYTGKLSFEDVKFISEADHKKINERSAVNVGDILFAMIGSIGNPVIVNCDDVFSIKNVALFKFYISGRPDNQYVHYFLSFSQKNMKAASSGAVQSFMSLGFLRSYLFPLPPLPEQRRIVAKIDQLMARCDELETLRAEREQKRRSVHTAALKQLLDAQTSESFTDAWQFVNQNFGELYAVKENVAELRKTILQLAVMGKLVSQNPNDPPASQLLKEIEAEKKRLVREGKIKALKSLPEIEQEEVPYSLPLGWEWVRLGNSMLKITDGTHFSPLNTDTGDFLYISARNIKDEGVLLNNATYVTKEIHKEIYSRCDPEFGNILYIKDGATTGIVTINNLREQFSMLSSVALLKQPTQISNRFILFTLRSPFFYQEMRAEMSGVAITRITLKKLDNALIPLPPAPEQHRIAAKIDRLVALCDALEQHIDTATGKQTELLNVMMATA